MTANGLGSGWLDCQGEDAGDGNVRCTIRVMGGQREIMVPAEYFDAQGSRVKVKIIRSTKPSFADCPSQEVDTDGFVVECPSVAGATSSRLDVLAIHVEPLYQF